MASLAVLAFLGFFFGTFYWATTIAFVSALCERWRKGNRHGWANVLASIFHAGLYLPVLGILLLCLLATTDQIGATQKLVVGGAFFFAPIMPLWWKYRGGILENAGNKK